MNWPFVPKWQFRRDYDPFDWNYTTATKQKNKIKYKLYWSANHGGLWVSME